MSGCCGSKSTSAPPNVLVFIENFLKRLCLRRLTEISLALHLDHKDDRRRNQNTIRIAWIDSDLRNLLAVAQTEMCPGISGIGRLVDTITDGKIRTLQSFTTADTNDVWT